MMFWLGVGAAYLALVGVGLLLGHWLGSRRRGWGGAPGPLAPLDPIGPTHAVDVPGLGSVFDQALLPGVRFGELAVSADAH
jgi:hypothetical protein